MDAKLSLGANVMHIFPPRIDIADDEGFDPKKDIFNRAEFGRGLANLLGTVEDPMVIAVDGQWGSGKTTFIKMWAGLLRQMGHPVIYFDAFASDYIDDAFLAIAGEVVSLSQKTKNATTSAHKKFLSRAARAGRAILRSGTKIGVKAATLGVLDAADLADLKSVANDIADELGAKSDEYIKALLTRHGDEQKNIEGFRKALSELAMMLSAKLHASDQRDSDYCPLIFIVDELDRCKPTFALDLLEKIKHVFSVSGVHFVLVTHLEQLENSVRFSYGHDIDARTYLQKFYNLIIHLPGDGKYEHERDSRKFAQYLQSHLRLEKDAFEFIDAVVQVRGLSLRSLEQILIYLSLAIAFTTSKTHTYFRPGPILGGLCVLKALEPSLFRKAKSGSLTFAEASETFRFSLWPDSTSRQWALKWWQYALDEIDLKNQEWQEFATGLRYNNFRIDRGHIIRAVANDIIDRMQIPQG